MVRLVADLDVAEALYLFGNRKFFSNITAFQTLFPQICDWIPYGCEAVIFALCGMDVGNLNATRMEVYVHFAPGTYSLYDSNVIIFPNYEFVNYILKLTQPSTKSLITNPNHLRWDFYEEYGPLESRSQT